MHAGDTIFCTDLQTPEIDHSRDNITINLVVTSRINVTSVLGSDFGDDDLFTVKGRASFAEYILVEGGLGTDAVVLKGSA